MKALSSFVLVLAIVATVVLPSDAAADKLLQNVRGDVSYQTGSGSAKPLATKANIPLSDSDTAITGGGDSLGAISLPDSSRILMGPNSKVTLSAFDQQPGLTTAKFVVVGKTRFQVEHPGGAKANYTFQTTTGQIAVRGTEGDITVDDQQLQVAVYKLTDETLPVEVNLNNGKKYKLRAGQILTVSIAGAAIAAAAVGAVSQSTVASSTATFGSAPGGAASGAAGGAAGGGAAGASSAGAAAGGGAGGAAGAAAAAAAVGGGVAAVGSGKGGGGGGGSNPTPAPGPLSVSPSSLTLGGNGAHTKKFTIDDGQNGNSQFPVTNTNPDVATVDGTCSNQCNVTAKSAGQTIVTVTDTAGNSAQVTVTVNSGPITFDPNAVKITPGSQTGVSVNVRDPLFHGKFASITITGDSGVATVSPTSGGPGTYTIVPGTQSGNAQLVVSDGKNSGTLPITSNATLSANPNPISLGGGTQQQTVVVSAPGYSGAITATAHSTSDVHVVVNPGSTSASSSGTAQFTVGVTNGSSSSSSGKTSSSSSGGASVTFTAGPQSIDDPVDVTFGTITADPTALDFVLGKGPQSKQVTIAQNYYIGMFQVSPPDSSVATVSYSTLKGPQTVITVQAKGVGSTSMTIKGASSSVTVQIKVTPSPAPTSTSIPICINLGTAGMPGTVGGVGAPGVPSGPQMHNDHQRANNNNGHRQPTPTPTPSCPPTPSASLPVQHPPAPIPGPGQGQGQGHQPHGGNRPPASR